MPSLRCTTRHALNQPDPNTRTPPPPPPIVCWHLWALYDKTDQRAKTELCQARLRASNWRRKADHEIAGNARPCTIGGRSSEVNACRELKEHFRDFANNSKPTRTGALTEQSAKEPCCGNEPRAHRNSFLRHIEGPLPSHAFAPTSLGGNQSLALRAATC